MAIVSLAEAKLYMRASEDDDIMVQSLVDRAQDHIERLLGFTITSAFGGVGQDRIPPALSEAICQLATWWYDARGAAEGEAPQIPFRVREIVNEHRDWTF